MELRTINEALQATERLKLQLKDARDDISESGTYVCLFIIFMCSECVIKFSSINVLEYFVMISDSQTRGNIYLNFITTTVETKWKKTIKELKSWD